MEIIKFFQLYSEKYFKVIDNLFVWYNSIGRDILNYVHRIFEVMFDNILIVAVIVSIIFIFVTLNVLLKKKKKIVLEPVSDAELPFVTVQIPTFNELAAIRCIKNCLKFDYPKDKYEIIIGDDSDDPSITLRLIAFAKTDERIRIIKRERNISYKPGNLNNMLKYSQGGIIVIFDSDFIPNYDFLRRIVIPFIKNKEVAGVQARWKLLNSNQNMISILGSTIVSTFHHIAIPFLYNNRKIAFLCGSAEAVRKDVLIKLGGWDNGNLTEDIEFSLKLIENGYKIEYLEDLECECEVPYTLKDLYKQQMRWAYGVISSYKKHFFRVTKSNAINLTDKFYMAITLCSGYLLSVVLAGLFITGALSFLTHPPEPINWGRFLYKLLRNIIWTSGLIFTSIVALAKANNKKLTLPMIVSSFSYGLVVTYYVNIGIFKALSRIPMEWYMLNKLGNKEELRN